MCLGSVCFLVGLPLCFLCRCLLQSSFCTFPLYPPVLGQGWRQPLTCSLRMEFLSPQHRPLYRH